VAMNEELRQFVEQIMALPASARRYGSTGDDITQNLQQSTYEFAQALQEPQNYSFEQIQKLSQEIEGSLLAEETVDRLGQPTIDGLIDKLHHLAQTNQ
jgi:CHASE3 domain sensor protein